MLLHLEDEVGYSARKAQMLHKHEKVAPPKHTVSAVVHSIDLVHVKSTSFTLSLGRNKLVLNRDGRKGE